LHVCHRYNGEEQCQKYFFHSLYYYIDSIKWILFIMEKH
jgi:hypothetical protein